MEPRPPQKYFPKSPCSQPLVQHGAVHFVKPFFFFVNLKGLNSQVNTQSIDAIVLMAVF